MLPQQNQSNWNDHKAGYNPKAMLDSAQVEQMTTNLLAASNLTDKCYSTILNINSLHILSGNAQPIKTQLSDALENKDFTKPIILQLCNGSHWITMGLLPNPNQPKQYYVVTMDGKSPDQEVVLSEAQIQEKANEYGLPVEQYKKMLLDTGQHQLDPKPVIKALQSLQGLNVKFITADNGKAFNVSVEGQQHNNSCGPDVAANSYAIIQTFTTYVSQLFTSFTNNNDFETNFKKLNDKNVLYQQKDEKYYVYGKETELSKEEVVKTVYTAAIKGKCTKENIEDELNTQLIKEILLQDAIEKLNFEGKSSEELKKNLNQLKSGTLTDDGFERALNSAGLLEAIENAEKKLKEGMVNWAERITVKDLGKRHNIDRQY